MPLSTPIVQLIDRDPVTIGAGEPISAAARALSGDRFHHLPVLDADGRLVGMLSTTDILRLNASADGSGDDTILDVLDRTYRVEDVMSKDLITVSHRATVADAARLLSAGGFHALPVVDNKTHLLGLVTTTDLIAHMLEAAPAADVPANLRDRLAALEKVYKAAQLYLHSGMAVREHERLEQALEAARQS